MKMRIRGNSIRLRLARGEVAQLASEGRVQERTEFAPGSTLEYAIERRDDVERVGARLEDHRVVVLVPAATVRRFAESDEVGFDGTEGKLGILVEKDWQCLKPREEDEGDAYPHPQAAK
jgi:hypothetical protein